MGKLGAARLFRPLEMGEDAGQLAIAAGIPEAVERGVAGGALRVVGRPFHGAEAGTAVATGDGVGLPRVEKGVPDAVAAPGREQDGFSKIESRRQIMASCFQRPGELRVLVVHAGAGCAADDGAVIGFRGDDQGVPGRRELA